MVPLAYVPPSGPIAYLSVGLGLLAAVQGISTLFAPVSMGDTFGIPNAPGPAPAAAASASAASPPSNAAIAYTGVFGARNLATGISWVAFALTGNVAALGVTYAGAAVAAGIDTYLVHIYGLPGKWPVHAIASCVYAVITFAILA